MEGLFNTSFSDIRVHVGPEARRIGAEAFTFGSNLFFAPCQFAPETPQGRRLLAHELAHVIQQREGKVRSPSKGRVWVVVDPVLEAEAERRSLQATRRYSPVPAVHRPLSLPAARPLPQAAGARNRALQAMFALKGLKVDDIPARIDQTELGTSIYKEKDGGEFYGTHLTHTFGTQQAGIMNSQLEITEEVTVTSDSLTGSSGITHPKGKFVWDQGISEIDDMIATWINSRGILKNQVPPLSSVEQQAFYYRLPQGSWIHICTIWIRVELTTSYEIVTTVNGASVRQKCKYRHEVIPSIGPAMNFSGTEYLVFKQI